MLKWSGLEWSEGPGSTYVPEKPTDDESVKYGPFGPYIQSQRLDIYKKYANALVEVINMF